MDQIFIANEKAERVVLQENPYFYSLGQELHLPFSFEQYTENVEHQASFIHEYVHLLQATTTVHGIYNFIGISERFVHFFNAIHGKNSLKFPMEKWAKLSEAHDELKAFIDYEKHYRLQCSFGDGAWIKKVGGEKFEFSMERLPVRFLERDFHRWHIYRKFGGATLAIPILTQAISEAQAECVAAYFQGIESKIFQQTGKEDSESKLFYTSIPEVVRRELPSFPTNETVFLLTDLALMTFVPDQAFKRGIDLLKSSNVPQRLCDWDDLRLKLKSEIELEPNSLTSLKITLNQKIAMYERHEKHEVISLFIQRLRLGLRALEIREKAPLKFFPWERSAKTLEAEIMVHIPVPYAKFSDGIRGMGNPDSDSLRKQGVLSASTFLFDVMRNKVSSKCPLCDDKTACALPRTIECAQFPWGRGDTGGGKFCVHGLLGATLGISNSAIESL